MGCNCGKKKISGGGITEIDQNLIGKDILTNDARSGKVVENVTNQEGSIVGYIALSPSGNKFSVFKHQIL